MGAYLHLPDGGSTCTFKTGVHLHIYIMRWVSADNIVVQVEPAPSASDRRRRMEDWNWGVAGVDGCWIPQVSVFRFLSSF